MENLDQLAVENFQEYLRIPSVHPDPNYDACVTFIKKEAESLGLPVRVHYCFPNKPVVIVTWAGKEPELPSIMLSGHMDVVPADEEDWWYHPFAAEMDEEGNIYARGAQDMKCVNIQYLEAIRRLKKTKLALRRTIHISFVPDEEIAGGEGMEAFVKSDEFKELNVGFALDEGTAAPLDFFVLYYGERSRWVPIIHCAGTAGHSSALPGNTAGEKANYMLDKFYQLRKEEKDKLDSNPNLYPGDVTSVNLTMVEGGIQSNIIPSELKLTVDCRIALTTDLDEFEETLNKWSKEAGKGVWIEYQLKSPKAPVTKLDDSNLFWVAFKGAFERLNMIVKPIIAVGATDARYLRLAGVPTLGFSPMNNTVNLAHGDDEHLNKYVFLRGIKIYEKSLQQLLM